MFLLIRIAFYPVTKILPLYTCSATLCTSISVSMYTSHNVVTFWLIFARYLTLLLHIFTFTYRGKHTQAHVYNQQTRRMATTGQRNLVERGERNSFVKDNGLAHTQKRKEQKIVRETRYSQIYNKRFEHIELPAKLRDYFTKY